MRKIYLNSVDWNTILFRSTGFPQMETELYSLIKELASRKDIIVILTAIDNSQVVLKYEPSMDKFFENPMEI